MTSRIGTQRVRLSFEYDADIFEGDPVDAFDLAKIEEVDILTGATSIVEIFELGHYTLRVEPVFEDDA